MRTNKNVRGLVRRNNEVLLIHRFKNGDEYWVVPGGGVEDEETIEEALRREMREETNLEIKTFKLAARIPYQEGEQYIYECEMGDGEMKLQGPEAQDQNENNQYILTWVNINKAKKLEVLYPEIVKDLL